MNTQRSTKRYYKDETFLKCVGENIRRIRHEKGLSQMELAFACNEVDYSQINRMELGKTNFSVSFLALLGKALGVAPEEFTKMPAGNEKAR